MTMFRSWQFSACLWALLAAGCGDASGVGTIYPVSGTITINGEPLMAETTMILFKPDASRGNRSPIEPAGALDGQGRYTLATAGKTGAPPGWYKVIVTATSAEMSVSPGQRRARPRPKSLVPARYGQVTSTQLTVEVVESPAPGAYDLKLTR
jgi:hypothetical protein